MLTLDDLAAGSRRGYLEFKLVFILLYLVVFIGILLGGEAGIRTLGGL